MRRFLHYLQRFLLYAIIIGNINGVIFAVDDADLNEDSEERLDSNGDDEKNVDDIKPRKARIHSTVDNILRINKHVDPVAKSSEMQKSRKEKELKKKEEELERREQELKKRESHNSLGKENEHNTDSDKDISSKTHQNTDNQKRFNRSKYRIKRAKSEPSSHSNRIYTVKTMELSPFATNKYLRNSYSHVKNYGMKYYKNPQTIPSRIEYKIKSFGESNSKSINEAASGGMFPSDKKFTIKSGNYFKNKKACSSSTGCPG